VPKWEGFFRDTGHASPVVGRGKGFLRGGRGGRIMYLGKGGPSDATSEMEKQRPSRRGKRTFAKGAGEKKRVCSLPEKVLLVRRLEKEEKALRTRGEKKRKVVRKKGISPYLVRGTSFCPEVGGGGGGGSYD